MSEKSLLQEILDDFTKSLAKNPAVGEGIAKSLRELLERGEYKNKQPISKLLSKTEAAVENP